MEKELDKTSEDYLEKYGEAYDPHPELLKTAEVPKKKVAKKKK